MGIIRKSMSVSTLGLVNFRNGSERNAAAIRKQAAATRSVAAQQAAQAATEKADRDRENALRLREVAAKEREAKARALHNFHMWTQTGAGQVYVAWTHRQKATCDRLRTIDNLVQESWKADCREAELAFPYPVEPATVEDPGTVKSAIVPWLIAAAILGFFVHAASRSGTTGLIVAALFAAAASTIATLRHRAATDLFVDQSEAVAAVRAQRASMTGRPWRDDYEDVPFIWLVRWDNWRGANRWFGGINEAARAGDYPDGAALDEITIAVLDEFTTHFGPHTTAALNQIRRDLAG